MAAALGAIAKYGGKILNGATGLYFGMETYGEARREGASKGTAFAKGAAEFAMGVALGPMSYLGLQLATGIPSAGYEFMKWQAQYRRQLGREQKQAAFQNAAFQDTQATYTMRQSGLAIAERSRYNTQQAMLGNEARFMKK